MGILDDAIREHLELKRRHGATDEELARQEAEALGPACREPPDDAVTPAAGKGEAAAPAADEEDVLEETPDFLQETPEHDRLWFEQRPPRGFDFEQ